MQFERYLNTQFRTGLGRRLLIVLFIAVAGGAGPWTYYLLQRGPTEATAVHLTLLYYLVPLLGALGAILLYLYTRWRKGERAKLASIRDGYRLIVQLPLRRREREMAANIQQFLRSGGRDHGKYEEMVRLCTTVLYSNPTFRARFLRGRRR